MQQLILGICYVILWMMKPYCIATLLCSDRRWRRILGLVSKQL